MDIKIQMLKKENKELRDRLEKFQQGLGKEKITTQAQSNGKFNSTTLQLIFIIIIMQLKILSYQVLMCVERPHSWSPTMQMYLCGRDMD